MINKRAWKYAPSGKNFKSKSSQPNDSPARRRYYDSTPKRCIFLISKTPNFKEPKINSASNLSSITNSPSEIKSTHSFKPSSKIYIELSQSPQHYDLKSKNLQKDIESFQKLINFDVIDKKKKFMRKEFNRLVKREIKKVESEREEIKDISFEDKKRHPKALEYFRAIRSGDAEKVISLLICHPELVKEVDSTLQTGLHWAVRRKNLSIIKYLLSCNVNIMSRDIIGRRAEDIARSKKFTDICEYLIGLRRRTGQHVSRIIPNNTEVNNNSLQALMIMQSRISRRPAAE
ncbi:hypothetical protein SteCoe_13592 [Stentor coeruleus]|uniref:Uncharacterized protein n=1 Tax=Stentor coeruleus TaxID=5963 RepID=A0A1R2C7Z3_9CILI|nr:hypothetical protein SteCoe_13592 [Stentor coeruleus]